MNQDPHALLSCMDGLYFFLHLHEFVATMNACDKLSSVLEIDFFELKAVILSSLFSTTTTARKECDLYSTIC